ncbi:MAG: DUF1559 domain-containing protein [Pirellulaceae bacterium]|nr:DUF1559 domain-containing protein [Pirellulaceae bacterium]
MESSWKARTRGFTLVELLVVIAIIGVLIGMTMPAVQSVRAAARRTVCMNQAKQLAIACLMHESSMRSLPANGWFYRFAADPRAGFGADQPGGWHYNILPWIEQGNLRDLGSGGTDAEVKAIMTTEVIPRVVATFVCPSRPSVPISPGWNFQNMGTPIAFGRSDYACNSGNKPNNNSGYFLGNDSSGVIYGRLSTELRDIQDGTTNTYLLGERYLNPDFYTQRGDPDNDQGWTVGNDTDVFRTTDLPTDPAIYASKYKPRKDTAGLSVRNAFGGPHTVFNMARCDGSVHGINYHIDPETHFRLGNREDGEPIAEL